MEEDLRQLLKLTAEQVSKNASVGGTTVNKDLDVFGDAKDGQKKLCIHGQYEDKKPRMLGRFGRLRKWLNFCDSAKTKVTKIIPGRRNPDEKDDHHSPLDPDDYIRFRVNPVVKFYQSRLPRYYRQLQLVEAAMVIGQVVSVLMAAFHLASWTSIAATGVATLTALRAFNQTEKKLQRYSNTVEKVNIVLPWWEQLNPIEKSNSNYIEKLVDTCEEIFRSECESWSRTSRRLSKMAKKAKQDGDNSEDGTD